MSFGRTEVSSRSPGLRAVIFDLDGVLFDSARANVALYNHMLEYVGLPPRAQDSLEVILRESMEGSLEHLMGRGERYHRALAYWRVMDPSPFIAELELFPGVRQVLGELGRRYTLAVITNRAKTADQALAHFDLQGFFPLVVTPTRAGVAKPDPRIMEFALERLDLAENQVVYVGDSSVDEGLCLAAGVRLIAFRNRSLRAWAQVEDLAQIPPLLEAGLS